MGHGRAERTDNLLLFMFRKESPSHQFYSKDLPEETRGCIGALCRLGHAKKYPRKGQKPLYQITERGIILAQRLDKRMRD